MILANLASQLTSYRRPPIFKKSWVHLEKFKSWKGLNWKRLIGLEVDGGILCRLLTDRKIGRKGKSFPAYLNATYLELVLCKLSELSSTGIYTVFKVRPKDGKLVVWVILGFLLCSGINLDDNNGVFSATNRILKSNLAEDLRSRRWK